MKIRTKKYLETYMAVSDEIKHTTNSIIRLHLLFCLFEGKKTMKEINDATHLSYSAISTNIRILEIEDYVLREGSHYYLSNVMRIYINNLLEFDKTIQVLNDFFTIFEGHKVRNISIELIKDFYLLEDSKLIESCGTDVYKVNDVIMNTLIKANEIKAILPISFKNLTKSIESFVENDKKAELKVTKDIFDELSENIDLNRNNIKIEQFDDDFNFLLLIANETMIFGLYRKDGVFDQNRILISKSTNSLKWANELFSTV